MIMAKDSNNNYVKIEDIKQQNSFNGISPIEFKGSGENLENYRIYGNTIDGESVGDRTRNLFDGFIQGIRLNTSTGLEEKNNTSYTSGFIGVENDNLYSYSGGSDTTSIAFFAYDSSKNYIGRSTNTIRTDTIIYTSTTFSNYTSFSISLPGNTNPIAYIRITHVNAKQTVIDDERIMLNEGSTALPYELYGYQVPVTVEGKNLFQTTTSSQTKNGVTFTVNNDGSVICNGTASKDTFFKIGDLPLASQSYILTGCPSDGGNDSYMLRCYKNGNIKGGDVGNGFNINDSIDGYGYIEIRIASGYTCDNLTFYPMIRKADIEDDTYEPYHDPINTNLYLPEQIKKVGEEVEYIDYGEQKQHRVRKNLLRNTAESQIQSGVTFTVNDDGSVTCNGTSTSRYFSLFRIPCYLVAGEYIISGCPVGGDSDTYRADIRISPNGTMIGSNMDIGVGATIVIDESGWYDYTIRIQGGYTVDDVVFKPMIRKADIEDDTYEPCIENTELDVTLPALPTLFGTNILSVNTNTKPSKVWGRLSDPIDILYVKDNLGNILFSKYHEISINGSPPLTYKAKKWGNLSNYLIYGNTIDGESVGDKTDNIIRDYAVVQTQAQYAAVLFIDTELIPNTTYSFTCLLNSSELRLYVNENLFNTISYVKDDVVLKIIVKTLSELPDSQKINGKWIMLKNSITEPVVPELSNIMMIKGSEMPAIYEPYGYRVPVTVSNGTDTKTTNLYLPEQIKMVGDEVEFIDFGAQKHYRVRKNLLNEEYIQGNPISNSTIRVKCKTPIPLVKGELYTISFDSGSLFDVSLGSSPTPEYPFAADTTILSSCGNSLNWLTSPYTFECVNDGYISVTIRKKDNTSITPDEVNFAIQFEKNSTATSYEPYIEDTELNVTLPALPTISGTNTLTVGTEVQPSEVDIKGKIKGIN